METKEPLYIHLHVQRTGGVGFYSQVVKNFPNEAVFLERSDSSTPEDKQRVHETIGQQVTKDIVRYVGGHGTYYGLHNLFPGREARYITFLRDPLARTLSHYNLFRIEYEQWRTQGKNAETFWQPAKAAILNADGTLQTIEEAIQQAPLFQNYMFKFLSDKFFGGNMTQKIIDQQSFENIRILEKIKEELEKLYFVGIYEQASDFLYLHKQIGSDKIFLPYRVAQKSFISSAERRALQTKILAHNQLDLELYACAQKINANFKKQTFSYAHITRLEAMKKIYNMDIPAWLLEKSLWLKKRSRLYRLLAEKYNSTHKQKTGA